MVFKRVSAYYRQTYVVFLVGIYAAFFSVQLFFNFDTNNYQQSNCSFQQNIQKLSDNKKQTALYKNHNDDCKGKSRLNKRFEPNEFIVTVPEIIIVPYATVLVNYPLYSSSLYSSFLLYYSLRGPPAIVA